MFGIRSCMSTPIWPVVTENLAEQIAATQAGRVHPVQLLPYLPMSLELIESTLDEMLISDRIEKDHIDGLVCYTFLEYLDRPVTRFRPQHGVYSDDPLEKQSFAAVSEDVRYKLEGELGALAARDPWPSDANWQHELIYLIQNLPDPTVLSALSGHSRSPFRKVDERVKFLQKMGAIQFSLDTMSFSIPPLEYPKAAYRRQDAFIRQFPGARKEEDEVRLVKALVGVCVILGVCALVAVTAKIPFILLLIVGSVASVINFLRIMKAAPKPLPEL